MCDEAPIIPRVRYISISTCVSVCMLQTGSRAISFNFGRGNSVVL